MPTSPPALGRPKAAVRLNTRQVPFLCSPCPRVSQKRMPRALTRSGAASQGGSSPAPSGSSSQRSKTALRLTTASCCWTFWMNTTTSFRQSKDSKNKSNNMYKKIWNPAKKLLTFYNLYDIIKIHPLKRTSGLGQLNKKAVYLLIGCVVILWLFFGLRTWFDAYYWE